MKSRIVLVMGAVICMGVMVPTDFIGYATSDISYAETVGSEIDVAKIELNMGDTNETSSESVIDDNVVVEVAEVLGMDVERDLQYSLIFGEELLKFNIVLKSTESTEELETRFKDIQEVESSSLDSLSIVDLDEIPEIIKLEQEEQGQQGQEPAESSDGQDIEHESTQEEQKEQENNQEPVLVANEPVKKEKPVIIEVDQSDALLVTEAADENYRGVAVQLSESDRDLLERLVMGEAGAEGYEGAALVAQAIRDTMVYKGFNSIEQIRVELKYSGRTNREPNDNVKSAVAYIFDNGGIAVKHTVFYFYAPGLVESSFHESQKFIIEHKGHRFFSNN